MFVCLLTAVFVGCGSSNTPRGIADKAMKCMKKKDIHGYFDYVNTKEEDKAQKEAFIQMAEEKIKENEDKQIETYECAGEDVDEEEGTATVTYEVKYKDGSTGREKVRLERDESGKWWIAIRF